MNDYEEKVINIMDSAKDNIRIQLDKAYKSGYEDAKSELGQNAIDLAHEESDRAYQQGLEDAWEAAKKIHDIKIPYEIFGLDKIGNGFTYASPLNWGETITAQEAISKIKEYEEQQKQDTIQVGDEVYLLDDNHPRVVTNVFDDGGRTRAVQISENGKWVVDDVKELHRTGKHFDQIAEVLKEMRGESK